ncbi:hypothetical protein BH09BAC3_BH09BAC3_17630 [soil metagenome]
MTSEDLQQRTKKFSLDIIKLFKSLPSTAEAQVLGKQLLRCSTSAAANYRAARRARSKAEFIAKLCIVVEESDEAVLWLELIGESGISHIDQGLLQEAREILYIMSASRKTAKE